MGGVKGWSVRAGLGFHLDPKAGTEVKGRDG